MFRFLRKALFYFVATCLVLVALVVGVMRLAMPQLPEYRDEIEARLSEAIDGDVRFGRLDARWRLRGPEVLFEDVVIGERAAGYTIEPVTIDSVAVGVSFSALALRRAVVIRHVDVRGVTLSAQRDAAGWSLQGATGAGADDTGAEPEGVAAGTGDASGPADRLPLGNRARVRMQDVNVVYTDAVTGTDPMVLELRRGEADIDGDEVRFNVLVRDRDPRGVRAEVLVNGTLGERSLDGLLRGRWQVSSDFEAVTADLARAILPPGWRLPRSGNADLAADVNWNAGRLISAAVQLDADTLEPPDGGDRSQVAGRAELTRTADGWLCAVDDFVVGVSDRSWPAASMLLSLAEQSETSLVRFEVANITVYDLPYLASFLPPEAARTVMDSGLSGTVVEGDGFLQFEAAGDALSSIPGQLADYEVNLDYEGLSVASFAGLPGFSNLSGTLRMTDDTGSMTLDAQGARLELPDLFASAIPVDTLAGTLIWRSVADEVRMVSDSIRFESGSLRAASTLEIGLASDGSAPEVALKADWTLDDVRDARVLFPTGIMHPKLTDWLGRAVQAGSIVAGEFELRGDLDDFPFSDDNGVFRARALAEGVVMSYAKGWPALTEVAAEVELDGLQLATRRNSGLSGGVPFRDADVAFENLRTGQLRIQTQGSAPLADLQSFAEVSPIARVFGGQLERATLSGEAAYDIDLRVPLKQVREFSFDARITTDNASLALDYLPVPLQDIDGVVSVNRDGAYARDVRASLLGQPVTLAVAPLDDGALQISANGLLDGAAAAAIAGEPLAGRFEGSAEFLADLRLPKARKAKDDPRTPLVLTVESGLVGMRIDLPYPAGKSAEDDVVAKVQMRIEDTLDAALTLEPGIDVLGQFVRRDDDGFEFERATVHLGEGRALLPMVPGLFMDGSIDRLRLGDWLALGSGAQEGDGWLSDNLQSVAVEVGDLYLFGQRIRDVAGTLQRAGESWLIDVRGPSVTGTVSLPRKLSGGEPIVFDMRRLALLEADPVPGESPDPTTLPPLRIRAESFALGVHEFGVLDAQIEREADGLRASRLATASDAFAISAEGSWLRDVGEAEGSRSTLTGSLTSSNVALMMQQLGFNPGINGDALEGRFDVSWAGGPSATFLASLDGDASLAITDGTLDELDPGAGRVVGLLSVAELPRRLSLDFSDVFRKGFTFSEIRGDFRIVNGDAYTCNLALQSTSADVGLIGRASLDKRNYNQTAIVSVKVGNTLPAVGAVVAGPQVGAALLLFSQIFKKPLQGMTEVYYQINGSWDEPSIDRTDAARFVATSDLAGCLLDAPN